ncbi:MAG: Sapep family Mn(2+)-dependent dipeptidase [Oscillospiraceae bacterium]
MTDFTKVDAIIDGYMPQMEQALMELAAIPSVEGESAGEGAPFGKDVRRALDKALALCDSLGFATCDMEGYCGYADLPGETAEQVGVLGHLDVVPADAADWIHPPFAPEIAEDRIYGRGTMDDKGPMLAALFGAKALADAGVPLRKTVRFIFGCNEETGMACMAHYLEHCPPPSCGFTPDAEWPLIVGEKGIMHYQFSGAWTAAESGARLVRLAAGSAANVVPAKAEAVLLDYDGPLPRQEGISAVRRGNETVVTAAGTAAHASTPEEGVNALSRLLRCLAALSFGGAEAKRTVEVLARLTEDDCYGSAFGVAGEDELSRTTHTPTVCRFTDSGFTLTCDMRFRLTDSGERYLSILRRTAEENSLTFIPGRYQDPLYLGADHPLTGKLLQSYRDVTGDLSEPRVIGGGTYAKVMPNFLAFGPEPVDMPARAHQADEYISRRELRDAARIYARAIARMAE